MTITVNPLVTTVSAIQIAESQVTNLTSDLSARLLDANNLVDVYSATAAVANIGAQSSTLNINAQTGTTYTLQASDFVNTLVTMSNASATTVTIPQTSTAFVSAGNYCPVTNLGAGLVTFVVQGSDTKTGNSLLAQGVTCQINKIVEGSPNTYNIVGGSSTQTFIFTLFVPTLANATYTIIPSAPFSGTITSISTICTSGTATATSAINGVNLGGTANSVSATLNTQAQASANVFSATNPITVTISSNSVGLNMALQVTYTRTF